MCCLLLLLICVKGYGFSQRYLPYVKALACHFCCSVALVKIWAKWVVPAALSVVNSASKARFKAVKSVHGMLRIWCARYAKHIVLGTASSLSQLYGLPLQGVRTHKIAVYRG